MLWSEDLYIDTHLIDFFEVCFGDSGIWVEDFFVLGEEEPIDYSYFLDDDDDDDDEVPIRYPLPCF